MGPVVRLIGSGIGLASEALAHHKQKRAEAANASSTQGGVLEVSDERDAGLISNGQAVQVSHHESHQPIDAPPSYEEVVNDEEDWELDEAGDEDGYGLENAIMEEHRNDEKPDVRKILAAFLAKHTVIANPTHDHGRLPCPVIIPQRRPGTKSRGFVKAYAPVLENCGIDQETWMDFLETFHKASQASPVFGGILIAGNLVGFVPSVSAMVASMLIQAAATGAIVLHSRSRTNTFLDDVNQHFFRPRGLFVLLIKYKGSRNRWSSEPLDISNAVATSSKPADAPKKGNRVAKFRHNLQYASGTSHGDMEIPESAPLIYPALDKTAAEAAQEDVEEANNKKPKAPGKFKKSTNFVNDYLDRRARAIFHAENPSSCALNTPGADDTTQFASRYSDPTHPAASGSLAALLTGGRLDPKEKRRRKDEKMRERTGFMRPMGYVRQYQPVRRMLKQEVLYLIVVNMPGEEEIQAANKEMERKGEKVQEGEDEEDE